MRNCPEIGDMLCIICVQLWSSCSYNQAENVVFHGLGMQMAEISRVLKPGGVFVASTFLKAAAPLGTLRHLSAVVVRTSLGG